MLALKEQLNSFTVKSYARTLYENYRARCIVSGQDIPVWNLASPVVRREFYRDAKNELGY